MFFVKKTVFKEDLLFQETPRVIAELKDFNDTLENAVKVMLSRAKL